MSATIYIRGHNLWGHLSRYGATYRGFSHLQSAGAVRIEFRASGAINGPLKMRAAELQIGILEVANG